MAIGAIAGAMAGVAGPLVSAFMQKDAADEALSYQKQADARMEARLDAASGDISKASDEYIAQLAELNRTFDPYDMSQAYDSFYEGVIVPLEREYAEFVNPAVTAAYSGGVMGPEAAQSGAAKEAQARSARDMASTKSQLTAQERDKSFSRNVALDARQRELAKEQLSSATLAPSISAGHAPLIHSAQSNTIAAGLAANQQTANTLLTMPQSVVSGIEAGSILEQKLAASKGTE